MAPSGVAAKGRPEVKTVWRSKSGTAGEIHTWEGTGVDIAWLKVGVAGISVGARASTGWNGVKVIVLENPASGSAKSGLPGPHRFTQAPRSMLPVIANRHTW